MATLSKLTEPQRRMLAEIRAAGGTKTYNGRARKTLEALEAAGLVEYDYELDAHANGRYTERFFDVKARPMTSEEYTADCERLASEASGLLSELSTLMRENGDRGRAQDVGDALSYLESAVEEVR